MNREAALADLREAHIRLKRWMRAVESMKGPDGRALVTNPGSPSVRTSAGWPPSSRWRVYERLKWTLDGTADGTIVDTECCVAAASTAGDVVLKYTLWVRDPNRVGFFRDRDLRGESNRLPPVVDPPEFAEQQRAAAEAAERANENATEWVKRAVRGQMAHIGMDDPVKFELAWQQALAMGAVRSR